MQTMKAAISHALCRPPAAGPRLATQRAAIAGSGVLRPLGLGAAPLRLRPAAAAPRAAQAPSAPRRQPKRQPKRPKAEPSATGDDFFAKLFSRLAKGAALLALAAAVVLGGARPAEAARSGGRVGGASFGRSMGGSSAFGRAAGGAMGGASLYGGARSFGGPLSYGGPYRSSVGANAFFFSPFGFGYGYGYPMGGGGGLFSLLFWGAFALIAAQAVRGALDAGGSGRGEFDTGERLSVAKVQVGLLGTARDLQRDLERIAARADTASPRGLHYVLQETVLALMRNPDYCVYGFAKSGVENSADEAEARFNKLSLEERGKFEKETRVNVGGITARGSLGRGKDLSAPVSELIVVTVLVAAEGRVKLPKVNSRATLVEALTTLGSVPSADVLAVEVLWTPEDEDDYFTQEDLARDYPLLNTL